MSHRNNMRVHFVILTVVAFLFPVDDDSRADLPQVHPDRFGIRVVDEHGRGVPLVELKTSNEIRCVTDNAGWIAWQEPGMMNREVCWTVSGPGIEREKDGFGFAVFRAVTTPGTSVVCNVKSTIVATRIGRLTGQGLYRDSELLGQPVLVPNVLEPGVVGQDSVQCVEFQDKLFWLWGDTNQARYPLGNFHTTCATTPRAAHPELGLRFDYFVDPTNPKLLKKMFPTKEKGVVWMFGLMSLEDTESGRVRMFAGFSRRPGLADAFEQGIAEFDPESGIFKKVADVAKDHEWGPPHGHAVRAKTSDGDHFYFSRPFAHCRVRADPKSIVDPARYERLKWDELEKKWMWSSQSDPTTQEDESKLISAKQMDSGNALYQMKDIVSGRNVTLHTASIAWNEYRKKYVLIGLERNGDRTSPSFLGEVWYSESSLIVGPWRTAIKIASHPQYSFYNPIHHLHFDRDGGRVIYFEGTYTNQFSGSQIATPRYDYNQIAYRLELDSPRLKPVQD